MKKMNKETRKKLIRNMENKWTKKHDEQINMENKWTKKHVKQMNKETWKTNEQRNMENK
jgi:hypothetical protein